jgi:ATP phosphoribosyltransferase
LENLDTGTSLDFNNLEEILTFLKAQANLIESTHLGVARRVIDG